MGERTVLDRIWPSLVALVGTVAVVVGLLVIFGDDLDDSADDPVAEDVGDEVREDAPTDPADTPTDGTDADGGSGDESGDESGEPEPEPSVITASPEDREPVGLLNATDIDGLETQAEQRFTDGGWEVPATAGWDEPVEVTTVFYPEGMEDAAEALMNQFPEVAQVEPTFEGINNTRLIVILGEDYAATVESPE